MGIQLSMGLVILAAGVAASPAWADNPALSARATITGLQMNLIDLRPDDGIAPSMRWASHESLSYVNGFIGQPSCFGADPLCVYDSSSTPFDTTLSVNTAGRGATVSSSMLPEGWTVSLTSAPASRPGFPRNVHAGALILDNDLGELITLSPHTALSVTGHYTFEMDIQPGAGQSERYVTAQIFMHSWRHNFSDSLALEGTSAGGHATKSGDFNWYLENQLNVEHTKGGWMLLHVDTVPPIPEPGTYALMLAGLGFMGTMVRRRRER
jgi:hypothetical protein